MVSVFLRLTLLSVVTSTSVHAAADGIISFFLTAYIPVCVCVCV